MPTAAGAPPIKVLLIEDNPADADLIREALAEAALAAEAAAPRFTLVHVDRLARGSAELAAGDVGVVLLDLSLPDSQGFATFLTLHAAAPETPLVILSGLDDRSLADRAVREGAQDYLVKGQVDGASLDRAIRYAVERQRAEADRARLQREQATAEAALRVRDETLASISHDLKTPLTAIKGIAQLMARRLAAERVPEPPELLTQFGRIDGLADSMVGLIDELLDAARLQAGRPLDLRLAPTDLVALARDATTIAEATGGRHDLCFDARVEALEGIWDGARLGRVLDNLLSNALKFSPAGSSIVVTVAREDGAARPAVVSVRDSGVGIPLGDLPHLFERFYRASNVAGQIRGTGIGLAGSRQIVEAHGGVIEVASAEGEGSIFTVRLPLHAAPRLA